MYRLYWYALTWHLHCIALTTDNGCLSVKLMLCQWCHVQEMKPDGEECQWWQLEQTGACVQKVCSENTVVFIAYLRWNLSKLYAQAHTGVTALSLKSYEKHHMRGRPSSSLQGQAAIQLTAGERWKWESTVSIDASSPAPQLCHFQSIAFRKSASTLQFEMKGLFCCEAHSVYNDLTVKKHAHFSEAFSPVAANYIICSCSK